MGGCAPGHCTAFGRCGGDGACERQSTFWQEGLVQCHTSERKERERKGRERDGEMFRLRRGSVMGKRVKVRIAWGFAHPGTALRWAAGEETGRANASPRRGRRG